jgi:hypothetical protein
MKIFICQLVFTILLINSVNAINSKFCLGDTILNSSHQNLVHKKSITTGILLTHFSHKSDNSGIESNIEFINPGIETLFHYYFNDIASFAIGLSYQSSKIIYGENSLDFNTKVQEISIPLLLTIKPLRTTASDMELSGGFYFGQYVAISNSFRIYGNDENNYAKLFSMDDFIGDIYLAIGKRLIIKKIPIGFDLFFRYRLKEHQLVNSKVSRPFYGVKFTYAFNLK